MRQGGSGSAGAGTGGVGGGGGAAAGGHGAGTMSAPAPPKLADLSILDEKAAEEVRKVHASSAAELANYIVWRASSAKNPSAFALSLARKFMQGSDEKRRSLKEEATHAKRRDPVRDGPGGGGGGAQQAQHRGGSQATTAPPPPAAQFKSWAAAAANPNGTAGGAAGALNGPAAGTGRAGGGGATGAQRGSMGGGGGSGVARSSARGGGGSALLSNGRAGPGGSGVRGGGGGGNSASACEEELCFTCNRPGHRANQCPEEAVIGQTSNAPLSPEQAAACSAQLTGLLLSMAIAPQVCAQLSDLAAAKGLSKALKLLRIAKREEVNQKRGARRKRDLSRYLANLILKSENDDEAALGDGLYADGDAPTGDDDDTDDDDDAPGAGAMGIPRLSIRLIHRRATRCRPPDSGCARGASSSPRWAECAASCACSS
ncbi:hypothetical protein T492DRAFT_373779 [Pavlovales sp. CCMP2436]|nr:hypothetical protein T492DRAFT_373779 [Pavlovales sp. CCMP2436]